MMATVNMIFNVRWLEAELKAVRLYSGLMEEGYMLGKSPIIPKNVAPTMARADENHALKKVLLLMKTFIPISAITVTKGKRKRMG